MAEVLLVNLATSVIEKVASYAAGEIKLALNHKKELGKLKNSLQAISAVLQDAENRQSANNSLRNWIKDLEDVVYDIDDLLDEVATNALQKKSSQGSFVQANNAMHFFFCCASSQKIRSIRERLDEIGALKRDFQLVTHPLNADNVRLVKTYSFVHEPEIIGREEAKKEILDLVLSIDNESLSDLLVIPVVGMGGLGKTALAKLVYNDDQIAKRFQMKLWVCHSTKFDLKRIIEDIIESGTGESKLMSELEGLQIKLRDLLRGKRYFLVLDDVWNEDANQWAELRNLLASDAGKGSVVLVTTRSARVASIVGNTAAPYNLTDLSFKVCWSIFSRCVFKEGVAQRNPRLIGIGKSMVAKCGGVPLAVKTLGSLLYGERDEAVWWQIHENELWKIDQKAGGIFVALRLSYDRISSHVKPCFVYCSTLTKGAYLYKMDLINRWMAQGLLHPSYKGEELEDVGNRYFEELLSRSLFQEVEFLDDGTVWRCKMHDLVHDLAASIAGEEQIVRYCEKQLVESPQRVRHIRWEAENLSKKELSKEEQQHFKAVGGARTFTFQHCTGKISKSFLKGLISGLKCLRVLDLRGSEFEKLPRSIGQLKHVRYLSLAWNSRIKALPTSTCNLLNLQTFSLYQCKKFGDLPRDIHKLVSLRHLYITSATMTSLPEKGLRGLANLRYLQLNNCEELKTLSEGVGHLTALRRLSILDCPKIASLPNSMRFLRHLRKLILVNCTSLDLMQGYQEGGLGSGPLNGLKSLESLEIVGLPKFEELPEGLGYAASSSLQHLLVNNCPQLTGLPDCLRHCTCLQTLSIWDCPKFCPLPQWFPSLLSLKELKIGACPQLSKSCKHRGHDWPLISHLPRIAIDGQWILWSKFFAKRDLNYLH
ncbi:hypothetical protein Ancab_011121 [Ancistrocladus abbreviatus]